MKPAAIVLVCLCALSTAIAEPTHKVVRENVRDSGLVATYFSPKGNQRVPAIIVLGGSQGGIPTNAAYRFAEHGWGALAVAHFGAEGCRQR